MTLPDLHQSPNHPTNVLRALADGARGTGDDVLAAALTTAADALLDHEEEQGIVYAGLQTYALTLAEEAVTRDDPDGLREAVVALLESAVRP